MPFPSLKAELWVFTFSISRHLISMWLYVHSQRYTLKILFHSQSVGCQSNSLIVSLGAWNYFLFLKMF